MNRTVFTLATTLAALALSTAARAAVLFDANGFEGPTYAPGNLQGQGGFGVSASADNQFLVTGLYAQSGDQSLRVFAGPNEWAYPRLDYVPQPGEKVVVETSIARNLGTTTANTTRRYGIEVYASTGLVTGFGLLGLPTEGIIRPYATAPIDPVTGAFRADGVNTVVALGSAVGANEFVNFRAEIDYATQLVDLYADGVAIAEDMPFTSSSAVRTDLEGAEIYRSSTTANVGVDRAHFDTYRVSTMPTSPVPEPASFAVLGLGALGLLRRRKRA